MKAQAAKIFSRKSGIEGKLESPSAIKVSRRSKGSRKTHRIPFEDACYVLTSLEAEASLPPKEWKAVLQSRYDAVEGKLSFSHKKIINGSMGTWRHCLMVALPLYSGFRRSDVVRMRWKDLVYKQHNGKMAVHETVICFSQKKTGKRREIPISRELGMFIVNGFNEIRPADLDQYVFESKYKPGHHITPEAMTHTINRLFARYDVYDQEGKVAPHSLRKTYGYNLWKAMGGHFEALLYLQQLFGHSEIGDTITYLDIKGEDFKDAHNALSFRNKGTRPPTRITASLGAGR